MKIRLSKTRGKQKRVKGVLFSMDTTRTERPLLLYHHTHATLKPPSKQCVSPRHLNYLLHIYFPLIYLPSYFSFIPTTHRWSPHISLSSFFTPRTAVPNPLSSAPPPPPLRCAPLSFLLRRRRPLSPATPATE
jgi:hypothetical protein